MPASGIRGTHDILLGSHLCLFYRRLQEILHVTAAFLKAGGNQPRTVRLGAAPTIDHPDRP